MMLAACATEGADISISLVAREEGVVVPLRDVQSLWQSPFGGWVVTTWPFGLKVEAYVLDDGWDSPIRIEIGLETLFFSVG